MPLYEYIPHSIFDLERLLYVTPETFGPYCVSLKSVKTIPVPLPSDSNNGTLHEGRGNFMTICGRILLSMRNISEKRHIGQQKTHFMFNNFFPKSPLL